MSRNRGWIGAVGGVCLLCSFTIICLWYGWIQIRTPFDVRALEARAAAMEEYIMQLAAREYAVTCDHECECPCKDALDKNGTDPVAGLVEVAK